MRTRESKLFRHPYIDVDVSATVERNVEAHMAMGKLDEALRILDAAMRGQGYDTPALARAALVKRWPNAAAPSTAPRPAKETR